MTLLATYQNHPGWISALIACAVAGVTYTATSNLLVTPKAEKIIALQQENKKITDELIKLESIKNSAEKNEQVITNALAKAQIDAERQTQQTADFKATNEALGSNLVQWQNGYKNLSAQTGKLRDTCNVISHIAAVSAQKDQMERNIAFQLNSHDTSRIEEYKRQADELQARLLKLEAGLTCPST